MKRRTVRNRRARLERTQRASELQAASKLIDEAWEHVKLVLVEDGIMDLEKALEHLYEADKIVRNHVPRGASVVARRLRHRAQMSGDPEYDALMGDLFHMAMDELTKRQYWGDLREMDHSEQSEVAVAIADALEEGYAMEYEPLSELHQDHPEFQKTVDLVLKDYLR